MGAAADVEKLETRISLTGVEAVQRGQGLIGAGFRAMRGDISGARAELKQFRLDSTGMAVAGGMIAGAGAAALALMRQSVAAAGEAEEAGARLETALRASGAGGAAAAADIAKLAQEVQSVTTAEDDQLINAAAMLASFKMNTSQIKEYLPRLVDVQQGLKKLGKEEMSLEQIAIMLGKGHQGNVQGLQRVGILVDKNAYKTKGYKAILEELDREFGGQGKAAAETYTGQLTQFDVAIGNLQESLGAGLLGPLKSINAILKPSVERFTAFNEATHGAAGTAIAVGGGLAVVTGGILLVTPGIKALIDMWLQVAGAATKATIAQRTASTAGAGAATTAAAGNLAGGAAAGAAGTAAAGKAAGGILGKLGGAAKGLGKGLGAGFIIGLAGDLVGGYGAAQRDRFVESKGKEGGFGAALAITGGGALKGAALGATLGSIIPGVGTAIGGAVGAAGGAIVSLIQTAGDKELANARGAASEVKPSKPASDKLATPRDPVAISSNAYLKTIADLMKSQTKAIVGGGKRSKDAYNQGDIQRAVFGLMSKAVA